MDGIEAERTDFNAQNLPSKTYRFGKLQQTLTYNADGTLATVIDGRGNTTTLSNWKRGLPQLVQFADQTSMSAVVNDSGTVASVTGETGSTTSYTYDAMGRINRVTYPLGDTVAWNPTVAVFEQVGSTEAGVPAGHWRQMVTTGAGRKVTVYDALWRPVYTDAYDLNDVAGTRSIAYTRYDTDGRPVFRSYPTTVETSFTSVSSGVRTFYDALGRATRVEQDSELGSNPLITTTEYLTGFKTRLTNPRGFITTTSFRAFDTPSYDEPVQVVQPEGAITEIVRDAFGKPLMLERRSVDRSVVEDRNYVYDEYQRLCKVIEPESGTTVMDYDPAGNVAWSASGLSLSNPAPTSCPGDRYTASVSGRQISRYYDLRNRLSSLQPADHNGAQDWTYAADGLPAQVITYNDQGSTAVVNRYYYNKRRLLTNEHQEQPNWYSWGLSYGYDANGALASQGYPSGLTVDYAPNALGRATRAGTFATNVLYYPNGGIKSFSYGNGLTHFTEQNARQLPSQSYEPGVLHQQYVYDANGNVKDIYDYAQGSNFDRHMSYDGLDRLTGAGSVAFGGDWWHRFTYDPLDNIRSWKLPGVKDYANYYYEPMSWQLISIQNSAGASIVGLGYDAQGNVANKNGQAYTFDLTNRLRSAAGKESYRYDALGRRVLAVAPSGNILTMYGQSGQLLRQSNERAPGIDVTENVYLAGSLVAMRHQTWDTGAVRLEYQHTDALGTPVAVTNEAGQPITRTNYDPYGGALSQPAIQGIGYTGQVIDAQTGLTYMQQRYYDPQIGRFLSVDPVTADGSTGGNFNRYWYGNNNPYKFTDPDGRMAQHGNIRNDDFDRLPRSPFDNPCGTPFCWAKGGSGASGGTAAKGNSDQALMRSAQSGRPTLDEANAWYRGAHGKDLIVDQGRLTVFVTRDERGRITSARVMGADWFVHGDVSLNPKTMRIYDGPYDFEPHNGSGLRVKVRNVLTEIGREYAGDGTPFMIRYQGGNPTIVEAPAPPTTPVLPNH